MISYIKGCYRIVFNVCFRVRYNFFTIFWFTFRYLEFYIYFLLTSQRPPIFSQCPRSQETFAQFLICGRWTSTSQSNIFKWSQLTLYDTWLNPAIGSLAKGRYLTIPMRESDVKFLSYNWGAPLDCDFYEINWFLKGTF